MPRPTFRILTATRTLVHAGIYAALLGVYALLPLWVEHHYHEANDQPAHFYGVLSIVLGVLLVFRTNKAYERWWEARILWGSLVNCCRNLAIRIRELVPLSEEERRDMECLIAGFPCALRDHLRHGASLARIPGCAADGSDPDHVPAWLTSQIYRRFHLWLKEGRIDSDMLIVLDREGSRLMDICGACERIRNTPKARSYKIFSIQGTVLYLLSLPWGLIDEFGVWTIPVTAIMAYFMIGLEVLADSIEEPFGHDPDDLDLDSLCETIRASARQILA